MFVLIKSGLNVPLDDEMCQYEKNETNLLLKSAIHQVSFFYIVISELTFLCREFRYEQYLSHVER